jgi:surface antigen
MPAITPKVFAAALAVLILAGCSGDPGPRTGAGVGLGALTGGLIGAAAGRGVGGVVAGAVIGGLVGGAIGNALDEEDRRRAYAAEMDALESGGPGAPVAWRGPHGAYGTVIAGPAYPYQSYERCREYTHTIYIQGRPQTARGVACRQPDGTWAPVS